MQSVLFKERFPELKLTRNPDQTTNKKGRNVMNEQKKKTIFEGGNEVSRGKERGHQWGNHDAWEYRVERIEFNGQI